MGPAVASNKNDWLDIAAKGARRIVHGETTIDDVLNQVGRRAAGDVVKAIKAVTSPPLSEVTVQKRFEKLKSASAQKKSHYRHFTETFN